MQLDFVKIECTIKFDPSSLILLCDDASLPNMLRWNDVYCRVYVSSCGCADCNTPNDGSMTK